MTKFIIGKSTLLLPLFFFMHHVAFAQKDIALDYIKDNLKKEKGKYGVYNKTTKKWDIEAEYDKATGVEFSNEKVNHLFFKFWIGNKFDLGIRIDPYKNFGQAYKIIIKDITDVAVLEPFDDYYYSLSFKRDGKWGCLLSPYKEVSANYDNPPTKIRNQYNEYLIVDSAGLKGLYSYIDRMVIPPGNYEGFELGSQFITITGKNGLKGYSLYSEKGTVEPSYVSLKDTVIRIDKKESHFIACLLQNGDYEFRQGTKLIDKAVLEKSTEDEKEEQSLSKQGLAKITTSLFSINVYQNWQPYCHVSSSGNITISMNDQTQLVLGNGPASWVNKEKKNLYGDFSITCETLEATFETIKSETIEYYGMAAATHWDNSKNDYTNPTPAEIAKAKTTVKPIIENVTTQTGQSGKTLFYMAPVPMEGDKLMYKLIVQDPSQSGKVKVYSIEFSGEADSSVSMEPSEFKSWQDYFKQILLSVR